MTLVKPPLFPRSRIHSRIGELSHEIGSYYKEHSLATDKPVLALILMKGALFFASELLLWLSQDIEILPLSVSSYHGEMQTTCDVEFDKHIIAQCAGRKVLIIEDVWDTGKTLFAIQETLRRHGATDIKTVVLLNREVERKAEAQVDWIGFKIPPLFVVGFGLDFQEKYRNLPYITTLE